MRRSLLFIVLIFVFVKPYAQIITNTAQQAQIDNYYTLALQYKEGKDGVSIDYNQAYNYFLKAANLGDAQSIYAVAYMHYKGLGCTQNYDTAAILFAQGAGQGKGNSLYFYGLCWRNGYGLQKNEDSAKYYLRKSADIGYKQASMELATLTAENSNDSAAQVLLQQINNAAIPDKSGLNQFNKIEPHLPMSEIITGEYSGWLIQYDWSGKHMVTTKKLLLNLNAENNSIAGEWIEQGTEGTDTAKIHARIEADSLLFNKTQYVRKDHYSPNKAIPYSFQNAKLNILQLGDSIYIAGNIEMFSPFRVEPSKPIFVALSRPGPKQSEMQLAAYPNPFNSKTNVQFNLTKSANVSVQLYNMNGVLIYNNEAGLLQQGNYSLPISNVNLVSGMYTVRLAYGNQTKTIKVIKIN